MAPSVQGQFGTYSSNTPIIGNQKCMYDQVWCDKFPQTTASLRRMFLLWQPGSCIFRTLGYGSLGTKAVRYIQLQYTYNGKSEMCVWPSLVWPFSKKCCDLRSNGYLMVASTLYYQYHQLWVPGSKGFLVYVYLVHIAPIPPNCQ